MKRIMGLRYIYLQVTFLVWISCTPVMAQIATEPSAKSFYADSIQTAKTFPLLHLLQNRVSRNVDPVFGKIKADQQKRITKALQECRDVSCYADALRWTDKEIQSAGDEFVALYLEKENYKDICRELRAEGRYALYESLADTAYLRHAWNDAAKGINRIFNVYIKGEKPHYVKIDSISFAEGDVEYKRKLKITLSGINRADGTGPFFILPLKAALEVLALNERREAINYEPLKGGLNQEPFEKIISTNFSVYPYSIILIPGLGPEEPGMALEPRGAKRAREGAERWSKGLAPFIVVSGGNVHPFKTPFNEAEEMKKYMVRELGIPSGVIFIEPHARHTTTNLRNTSRLIYRFGIPANKPVLIVTDESQSTYIIQRMDKNAIRDLGYEPYDRLRKVTEQETEFYPTWKSMHADPFDPLDP